MALYEYRFVDEDGVAHYVERRFPMGEAPATVTETVHDAVYTATRVFGTAGLQRDRLAAWALDLPPENSPILE